MATGRARPDGIDVVTGSGLRIRLRPLRPDECGPVRDVFDGLSEESRRWRFLQATPRLSEAMLALLCDVDQRSRVAWLAEHADDGVVGVGRLARADDDPDGAEFAIAVVDSHQGRGIGRLLADVLALVAADLGIREFRYTVHAENRGGHGFLSSLGARLHVVEGELVGSSPVPAVVTAGLSADAVRTVTSSTRR